MQILRLLLAGVIVAGSPGRVAGSEWQLGGPESRVVGSEVVVKRPGPGGEGHPPVRLEIRYAERPAEKVELVWGVDGWLPPPAEGRPEGSTFRRRVLHSPMLADGGAHRLVISVPQGARVDYGFLVTLPGDSVADPIWRESPTGEPLIADRDRVIVHGPSEGALPGWRAVWGGGAVVCLLVSWVGRRRPLPRTAFLDMDPTRLGVARISAGLAAAVVVILIGAWVFVRVGGTSGAAVPGGTRAGLALFDPWIASGLPAWFSASLMALAAVNCVGCFLLDQARGIGRLGRWLSWAWLAMAAGFLMMSGSSPGSWAAPGSAGFGRLGWPGKVVAVAALLVLLLFGRHLRRDRLPALLTLVGAGCFIVPLAIASTAVETGGALDFRQVVLGRWAEMSGSLAFAVAAMAYLSRGGGFLIHFELASGWTFVAAVVGAFVLVWIAVHGGVPGVGVPVSREWFPATLAAIAAVVCYYLSQGYRGLGEFGRARMFAGWMAVALMLSVAFGVGLRSWVAGSGREGVVDGILALAASATAVAGCIVVARPVYGLGAAAWLVAAGELLQLRFPASGWGELLLSGGMWGLLLPPVVQLARAKSEHEPEDVPFRVTGCRRSQ